MLAGENEKPADLAKGGLSEWLLPAHAFLLALRRPNTGQPLGSAL